uniref:Uncharacterized protein n=1 Tax=Tanacetum cinerariifolium TaxID=118510 RepID=A0A6L2JQN0_TANCI|nr:hypothetical protein [Tanacetum cinerariifolium]
MHADLKYAESLEKEIDELESDKAKFSNMYDILLQEFDSDHFACVTKLLSDVNARTKKPNVVPISSRKPKGHANKSVATPPKKTVASESTIQKSKSYYKMLYEKTSKAWKWWIEQQCPSGYKCVSKTKTKLVPKAKNENVKKRVSFAIDNISRITNVLKLTIVQLILFIVDSGCTKHMPGNLKLLCNFVEKYLGIEGPLRMHFFKASPFGLVSMYHKNRERHCGYRPVASIGGQSLEPATIIKLDASAMSPQELVEWAEQEAGSPYLRTPPIKPRRKGIEFPSMNLFRDFFHCDSVADEIVLHDNWKYEGLSIDGPIDVGGPSIWCDLVHECVVEKGDSLLIMDNECFSNNIVLDDVVLANRKSMPLLLMKKGRNKVSVTRKSRCRNNSKTFRLRKGFGKRVACGANTQRLGGSPSLNVHVVDEDSQVTKQGSMSAGSSNTEDRDLGSLSAGSSNTDDKDLEKTHTSGTVHRHYDFHPGVSYSGSCLLD